MIEAAFQVRDELRRIGKEERKPLSLDVTDWQPKRCRGRSTCRRLASPSLTRGAMLSAWPATNPAAKYRSREADRAGRADCAADHYGTASRPSRSGRARRRGLSRQRVGELFLRRRPGLTNSIPPASCGGPISAGCRSFKADAQVRLAVVAARAAARARRSAAESSADATASKHRSLAEMQTLACANWPIALQNCGFEAIGQVPGGGGRPELARETGSATRRRTCPGRRVAARGVNRSRCGMHFAAPRRRREL